MIVSQDTHDPPPQLVDASARLNQAKENYASLAHELNEFMYDYVKGMVNSKPDESGNFSLRLRHPKESNVIGRPVVLISQIVENLRTTLDYMIFELSLLNEPDLNERVPQFVIADSRFDFEREAKTRLRHLTTEQKSFVEQLQPYNGNWMLALLGELAIQGKHRRLLSLRDNTGLDIYFCGIEKWEEYQDCFIYPLEKGKAIFAKPKDQPVFLLTEKYDAMPTLKKMIEHTADIVRVSYCFFRGLPLELTITRESGDEPRRKA